MFPYTLFHTRTNSKVASITKITFSTQTPKKEGILQSLNIFKRNLRYSYHH